MGEGSGFTGNTNKSRFFDPMHMQTLEAEGFLWYDMRILLNISFANAAKRGWTLVPSNETSSQFLSSDFRSLDKLSLRDYMESVSLRVYGTRSLM